MGQATIDHYGYVVDFLARGQEAAHWAFMSGLPGPRKSRLSLRASAEQGIDERALILGDPPDFWAIGFFRI